MRLRRLSGVRGLPNPAAAVPPGHAPQTQAVVGRGGRADQTVLSVRMKLALVMGALVSANLVVYGLKAFLP